MQRHAVCEGARRIVEIYRRRWLIEDYHKAVKTGYRIEDSQLKQASRILALFGIIGVIATQLLREMVDEQFKIL